MTVLLIRRVAKELAGTFYEEADGGKLWADDPHRSARFRDTYPTVGDYLRGYQRCRADFRPLMGPDGHPVEKRYFRVEGSDRWWRKDDPGWIYFVEVAVRRLANMLADPSVSMHEKREIEAALIKHNERATSPHARAVLQRRTAGQVQVN